MSRPEAYRAPIGTRDVLPPESGAFALLVARFAAEARRYGFALLVSPLFEDVGVFNRGIGESSEVARKEMYVFEDRSGRRLALRPEGTASVVRAFVQHHPTPPWKVWYLTPAFRYERPQAGRYRQHHQVGAEALGSDDPSLDVELIALAHRFYAGLGLRRVELSINTMGDAECRPAYLAELGAYLAEHAGELCDEHAATYSTNPLRVLDCKRHACVGATSVAPRLLERLCGPCAEHFAAVRSGLDALGIAHVINDRLVRGFDYYTRTTFEFASLASEASQNAIGGGGRYDGLAEQLGGERAGGVGFGSGIERLLLALEAEGVTLPVPPAVEVFVVDTTGTTAGLEVLEALRSAGVAADRAYDSRSMKAQMKQADRSGAVVAVIIGPAELAAGEVTMRDLRGTPEGERQRTVSRGELVDAARALLDEA